MMQAKTDIHGDMILELIPQRPPMVMVDSFYGIEDEVSRSALTVTADNAFCIGGSLAEPGILEHMAQSAAARIGYIYRDRGKDVPLGFIASIEKMQFYGTVREGSVLETEVTVLQEIFGISLVRVETRSAGDLIAAGNMKIFLEVDE